LCESIKNSGLEGRGGQISTVKHKGNGLAAPRKKMQIQTGINPNILKKAIMKWRFKHEIYSRFGT